MMFFAHSSSGNKILGLLLAPTFLSGFEFGFRFLIPYNFLHAHYSVFLACQELKGGIHDGPKCLGPFGRFLGESSGNTMTGVPKRGSFFPILSSLLVTGCNRVSIRSDLLKIL